MNANALFVNLSKTYPILAASEQSESPTYHDILRNITCGWWRVSVVNASAVRYLFGVHRGVIVSAYEVAYGAQSWPTIESNPNYVDHGRRFVPTTNDREGVWMKLLGEQGPSDLQSIRYARLLESAERGVEISYEPKTSQTSEELED